MEFHATKCPFDSMAVDFRPALAEAEESSEQKVDRQQLSKDLAKEIYIMALERKFFQSLVFIDTLRKRLDLERSFCERGASVHLFGGVQGNQLIKFPFDMNIPWPILQIACKFEYLFMHSNKPIDGKEYKSVLFDCFKALDQYPGHKKEISLILDFFRNIEYHRDYDASMLVVSRALEAWRNTPIGTEVGRVEATGFCSRMANVDAWLTDFNAAERQSISEKMVFNNQSELRAKKLRTIYSVFVGSCDQAIRGFNEKVIPETKGRYCQAYACLDHIAKVREVAIDQLIGQIIPPDVQRELFPPIGDTSSYAPHVVRALEQLERLTVPTPDEYSRPLQPAPLYPSLIERYVQEFKQRSPQPQRAAASTTTTSPLKPQAPCDRQPEQSDSLSRSDFLPKQFLAQQMKARQRAAEAVEKKSRKGKRSLPVRQDEERAEDPQHRAAHESSDQVRQRSQAASSCTSPSAESFSEHLPAHSSSECTETSSSQRGGRKQKEGDIRRELAQEPLPTKAASSQSTVRTTISQQSSSHESPESSCAVRVDDGPDASAMYADYVGRWANPERDVFQEDPNYRSKTYSEELKREIRYRHSFGRALIPVIIKVGKRFEKKDPRTSFVFRENFTLPGDITRHDGSYEKVVFTVSRNPRSKEIFHVYATRKTPLEIIREYAKDGCFAANDEEVDMTMPTSPLKSRKSYSLGDDRSRVTEVSNDCITVTEADGTKLSVYPFPDV